MSHFIRQLPELPQIGRELQFYKHLMDESDEAGDPHGHAGAKVGQYITMALDPHLEWAEKLRYFRHAMKKHCPMYADDPELMNYYGGLCGLIRRYAGAEALRLASEKDDCFAARQSMGQPREVIEDDAEDFFDELLGIGDACPEWFDEDDYRQIKLLRDQWI